MPFPSAHVTAPPVCVSPRHSVPCKGFSETLLPLFQFGLFETMLSGMMDEFPHLLMGRKTLITGVACLLEFLLGLPCICQGGVYVLQIMDWYCASFSLMLISLAECMAISWAYGQRQHCTISNARVFCSLLFVADVCSAGISSPSNGWDECEVDGGGYGDVGFFCSSYAHRHCTVSLSWCQGVM